MGGAAKAVTDVVEDAVDVVGDVFEGAVDIVKEAGSWIDDNILQPAKDDPIKTAITIHHVQSSVAINIIGKTLYKREPIIVPKILSGIKVNTIS